MASFLKRGSTWRAQVRVTGHKSVSESFPTKMHAVLWAAETEREIRKSVNAKKELYKKFGNKDPFGLTPDRILSMATPNISRPGIYFLLIGQEVMYVGQSMNVSGRIAKHAINGREFDSFVAIACEEDDLDFLEQHYITTLKPRWNKANVMSSKAIKTKLESMSDFSVLSA